MVRQRAAQVAAPNQQGAVQKADREAVVPQSLSVAPQLAICPAGQHRAALGLARRCLPVTFLEAVAVAVAEVVEPALEVEAVESPMGEARAVSS